MEKNIVNGPAEEADTGSSNGERKNPLSETLVQMKKIEELQKELAQRRELEKRMDELNTEVARQRDVLSLRDTEITKLHQEAATKLLTGEKANSNPATVPFVDDPLDNLWRAGEEKKSFGAVWAKAWDLPSIKAMDEYATKDMAKAYKLIPDTAAFGAVFGTVIGACSAVPAVGATTVSGLLAGAATGLAIGGAIGIAVPVGLTVVTFFVAKASAHTAALALAAYAKARPFIGECMITLKKWIDGAVAWLKGWFAKKPELKVALTA